MRKTRTTLYKVNIKNEMCVFCNTELRMLPVVYETGDPKDYDYRVLELRCPVCEVTLTRESLLSKI